MPFSLDSLSQWFVDTTSEQSDGDHISKEVTNEGGLDFTVQGQRKDHNTIFLKLNIADSSGTLLFFHIQFRRSIPRHS